MPITPSEATDIRALVLSSNAPPDDVFEKSVRAGELTESPCTEDESGAAKSCVVPSRGGLYGDGRTAAGGVENSVEVGDATMSGLCVDEGGVTGRCS